jgi:glyoxylase-like metal-dependent hydrolase (beta-lactamase superfamily II)
MIDKVLPFFPDEKFECNGYLVKYGERDYMLFDAPTTAIDIVYGLAKVGMNISAIFLTHGHFDHIEGLPELAKVTGAKVYIAAADKDKLKDDTANRAIYHFDGEFPHYDGEVITLTGGEQLTFGETQVEVIAVPGHTKGCLAYVLDKTHCFSGDFVFRRGIGRTDFDDSSEEEMGASLRKFTEIKENLKIYPGHGNLSTLDEERRYLSIFAENI